MLLYTRALGVNPNTRKPMFQYHKQTIDHVREQLIVGGLTIDQFVNRHNTINPTKLKSSSENMMAGGVGFEPTTTSLGGLRPVRARLPALVITEKQSKILVYCSLLLER
jgi:hypothetical protein